MNVRERGAVAAKTAVLGLVLLAAMGCDRLQKLAGKGGDDAGAAGSASGLLSFFGSDFEGEITMGVKSREKTGPTTLVFAIKKPRVRLEIAGQGMAGGESLTGSGASLLLDPTQKKAWALMASQKKAMLFDLDKMKDMPPGMLPTGLPARRGGPGAQAAPSAAPKIEKTGKTDTVAGYGCDVFRITQPDGRKAEVCAADGISWVDVSDLGWSSPEMTAAAALSDANRFPLRIVSTDPTGAEEVRLEATKIEKKKLDDASFTVPADY